MKNLIITIVVFLLGGMSHLNAQQAFGIVKGNMNVVVAGTPARSINDIPFTQCQITSLGQDSAWVGEKLSVIKKDGKFYLKINTTLPAGAEDVKTVNGRFVQCLRFSAIKKQAVYLFTPRQGLYASK